MTREEAIKTLKGEAWSFGSKEYREAFNMAIKALEQKPCEDAVSRNQVVEWLQRASDDSIQHAIDSNLEFMPPVTPTQKEWIPVSERLPKCEQKVLVKVSFRNNPPVITTGMYEDGSMSECDSVWNWEDVEFEKWDDENDCGIVPEGWYEYHEFNPDGVLNYAIYGKVVAWMPLPEPYKADMRGDEK